MLWPRTCWPRLPSGLLRNEYLGSLIIVKQQLIILVLPRRLQFSGLEAPARALWAPPGCHELGFREFHSFVYSLPPSFTHQGGQHQLSWVSGDRVGTGDGGRLRSWLELRASDFRPTLPSPSLCHFEEIACPGFLPHRSDQKGRFPKDLGRTGEDASKSPSTAPGVQ